MVNFASYNVRGLRDLNKRVCIFKHIRNKNLDVVGIQESHSTKNVEKLWKSQFGGQIVYAHGESNARGCMLLIRRNVKCKIKRSIKCKQGRFVMVLVNIKGIDMLIANIYAPNTDDPLYFKQIFETVASCNSENIVIMGDFNTTLETIDKRGVTTEASHPKTVKVIKANMDVLQLLDIWRSRHPFNKKIYLV